MQPFWDAGPQPLRQRIPELPKVGGLTCDHMEPQTFLSEPRDFSEGIYPWVFGKSAAESKRLRAEVTGQRLLGPLCLLLFIFSVSKLIPAHGFTYCSWISLQTSPPAADSPLLMRPMKPQGWTTGSWNSTRSGWSSILPLPTFPPVPTCCTSSSRLG